MRLLLDTHALIWALSEPGRLSSPVRALVEDPANEVFTSAASAWEIAIKAGLGKIEFPLESLS
jgi:PIN domain nuclease of toxin-antitoxin system